MSIAMYTEALDLYEEVRRRRGRCGSGPGTFLLRNLTHFGGFLATPPLTQDGKENLGMDVYRSMVSALIRGVGNLYYIPSC